MGCHFFFSSFFLERKKKSDFKNSLLKENSRYRGAIQSEIAKYSKKKNEASFEFIYFFWKERHDAIIRKCLIKDKSS